MSARQPDIEIRCARRIVVSGRVQGVGFRPFVFRAAHRLALAGWVRNETGRVVIHAEGQESDLDAFARLLIDEAPPLARPQLETYEPAHAEGSAAFCILKSSQSDEADVHLPPDLFCCADCVAELQNPTERRHRYAFTNCTQCGPRYTIIGALPYDRPSTSMSAFALCPSCGAEYEDPFDRRFHAQPLACPDCGPTLSFRAGGVRHISEAALTAAIGHLRAGAILAVKGIGGYHLMCDAADDKAVRRLRGRKCRPHKPFAIMFPQTGVDGLSAIREHVELSEDDARACAEPVRPIVLARKRKEYRLGEELAPGLAELGVFLPYSPLHHLLLAEFGAPLVATSGNISGEPVIIDNAEAEKRLGAFADAFLDHDRPILRPADDSVLRVIAGVPRPIRLGRGIAPLELNLPHPLEEPTLAVGGHLKATVAFGWGRRAVVSPHIGDLDSPRSLGVFRQVIADLQALYRVKAERIVCDSHPRYRSTVWAAEQKLPVVRVQHHRAHASALAGEHPDVARWLVFTWDGAGLGDDGDLWGGEAFVGSPGRWRRIASLRPFHVLGGDEAGRQPWRSAAALFWETGRKFIDEIPGINLAQQAWQKRVGTNRTSSVGRLFDAAASLVLGVHETSYEGQGPMMLESCATPSGAVDLPLYKDADAVLRVDWEPLLPMLCNRSLTPDERAGIFHESLAQAVAEIACAVGETYDAVGLTGGVFQNRILCERAIARLADAGIAAYLPSAIPANDGGLAFGQIAEVLGRDHSAISGVRTT